MQRLAFTVIVVCLLVVVGPARVVYAQSTACPSTVPYGDNPAAGRFVTVNGVRVYYELYGRGPTLVLLHGNGGSIGRMACLITKFSSTHAIIAIDSRGRGKSEDGETPFTFEQQADDVAALLEHERIESTHIRSEHYLEIYRNLSRAHFLIVPGVTHGGPTGIMSSDLFYAAAARFLKEEFVRPASR